MNPSRMIRTITMFGLACTLVGCAGAPRSKATVVSSTQPAPQTQLVSGAQRGGDAAPAAMPAPAMPAPAIMPGRSAKPAAPRVASKAESRTFGVHGFKVYEAEGGRLWVFRSGSDGLHSFLTKGEPAKRVTQIGTGPDGRTLMGSDTDAITDYANSLRYRADGYRVVGKDGRLWVFKSGSEHHKTFETKGEPAKRVTLIGEGPDGLTLLGADKGVMRAYAAGVRFGLPGYAVHAAEEGRLWVFKAGSEHHTTFKTKGEPAKRVTLIAEGPEERTLLGSDKAVMQDFADSWRYAAPGFVVIADDGRLWVFRAGSEAYEMFKSKGEPAKRVTLIGTGPDGRTLMGAERSTLEAYARVASGS